MKVIYIVAILLDGQTHISSAFSNYNYAKKHMEFLLRMDQVQRKITPKLAPIEMRIIETLYGDSGEGAA